MSNGFAKYESDCDKVWIYRLRSSYYKIQNEISTYTGKYLKEPIFDISSNSKTKWGSWNPKSRVMTFSKKLLTNYEWGAVEHVMRHETAHQIVSEIFDMDCYGVAHGEAWAEACKIVNIEPNRTNSHNFLADFKGTDSSPMVDKIRKIIIHANDKASTEEEAEVFMRKAKELMLRHDIEMTSVMGTERVFVSRPFGPLMKRWATYMWSVGNLLRDHYDVKHIRTWGPNGTSRLELFGEPDKLDIAEYVGHALLNQAELLYEQHKKEVHEAKAKQRQEDKENGIYHYRSRRLSKRAFIEGVVSGYSAKLRKDKEITIQKVEEDVAKERALEEGRKYNAGDRMVVPVYNHKLLAEMYGKEYPHMRNVSTSWSYGEGRGAGHSKGSSLTLSKGVNGNGNRGRLLGA